MEHTVKKALETFRFQGFFDRWEISFSMGHFKIRIKKVGGCLPLLLFFKKIPNIEISSLT